MKFLTIWLNEERREVPEGITLLELRDRFKPNADILVVNGFPQKGEVSLKDKDQVVLITRGEIPNAKELEALLVARHSPGLHERMKRATVGIAGLGGLGSAVAIALARMGLGRLILVDFDIVEPSNLNRQHYTIQQIGMAKTEAMSKNIAGSNPYVEVITHPVVLSAENIPVIFKEAEIIVECFDRSEAKAMILQTVAEHLPETYFIGASGLAGYGSSNSIRTMKLGEKIFMVGDFFSEARPGWGLMAPRVGIAAHHQANLAVSLLMDPEGVTL